MFQVVKNLNDLLIPFNEIRNFFITNCDGTIIKEND